ncbi:MAG: DUF2235 domain-containing protein, partial [Rhodospirillales bacterium]|nr:DUF2235 domain-containing protein [Rhodospirillales bacterium]
QIQDIEVQEDLQWVKCHNLKIRFLGLWDTVPAMGVPGNSVDLGWRLDVPSNVRRSVHAMSLDEWRSTFLLHRPKGMDREVWFSGIHGDVGGGNGHVGRTDITLGWMIFQAQAANVPVGTPALAPNSKSAISLLGIGWTGGGALSGPLVEWQRSVEKGDLIHITVLDKMKPVGSEYWQKWWPTFRDSSTRWVKDRYQ